MIRRILFLLPVLFLFFACSDDDEIGFDVPMEFRKISFDPMPGGAVMRYRLPDNMDIFGIRARYTDAYGRKLVKEGTYLTDTLLLNGFTEARTNEPVRLTFLNNNLEESAPLEMTFNTEDAATVALFENLSVNPFWGGGFNIIYSSPATVEGTVHIFYVGINPATQREDNILLGSFPIAEGGDTLNFEVKQEVENLKVIVRTDDYEGNTVKVQTYEGVENLTMEPLAPEHFTFSFPDEVKIDDDEHQIGVKYLFDGQKKGANYRKNYQKKDFYKYGTFMAGPYAFNKRFIIDFGTPKVPAMLRGDAFLFHGFYYPNPLYSADKFAANLWNSCYTSRLPAKIKVYGTNAADPATVPLGECTVLYKLEEDPSWPNFHDNGWCRYSDHMSDLHHETKDAYRNKSDEEFENAEPISLDMKCNYFGEDTWMSNNETWMYPKGKEENLMEYITFDELEVFVKKEYK